MNWKCCHVRSPSIVKCMRVSSLHVTYLSWHNHTSNNNSIKRSQYPRRALRSRKVKLSFHPRWWITWGKIISEITKLLYTQSSPRTNNLITLDCLWHKIHFSLSLLSLSNLSPSFFSYSVQCCRCCCWFDDDDDDASMNDVCSLRCTRFNAST